MNEYRLQYFDVFKVWPTSSPLLPLKVFAGDDTEDDDVDVAVVEEKVQAKRRAVAAALRTESL